MTLELKLPTILEKNLLQEAERQGVSAHDYTLKVLEEHLAVIRKGKELAQLLQSWLDEDNAEEQKETGDDLIRALDENRLSDRELFPPGLRGVTW